MKYPFLLCLTLLYTLCSLSQTQTDGKRINDFKNDFISIARLYKYDTLVIKDTILIRQRSLQYRTIVTHPKNKKNWYEESYYNDTRFLRSIYHYDSANHLIGLSWHYATNGTLDYTQDYDKGTWTVYNKKHYPLADLQEQMHQKADSIVAAMYGKAFLDRHAVMNLGGSYIRKKNDARLWTDSMPGTPENYLIRYDVHLDKWHKCEEGISIELDATGHLMPDYYLGVYGFEKIPESYKTGFKLTYEKALAIARQKGLVESYGTKAKGNLEWRSFHTHELYNGQFIFYISFKTATINQDLGNRRSSLTDKYDTYWFNPWTGEFIEKKKMKTVLTFGPEGKKSTGLVPDE